MFFSESDALLINEQFHWDIWVIWEQIRAIASSRILVLFLGKFGDCCNDQCYFGFALGKNAEEYDWSERHEVPVTTWMAGSDVEVQWHVGSNHAGKVSTKYLIQIRQKINFKVVIHTDSVNFHMEELVI